MARHLINGMALVACLAAGNLWAQASDPTRPPAGWEAQAENGAAAGNAEAELRLQSVIMPQGGKPRALIGGQTVNLGGQFGESTLIRLTEKEAVLKGPEGVTHLYLAPEVTKQNVVTPKARRTGKSGQLKDLP